MTARNRPEIEGAAGEPTSPWPAEPEARRRRHGELRERIAAVLADESDLIARMATAASLLFEEMPHASFVGFYRAHPGETLVIGPYQGPLACLRIPFGRGVCGTAATEGRSILVPDVHAFPGHIACDSRSRSELVIPVRDPAGALIAVLDLDSHLPAAFDEIDRTEIERLAGLLAPATTTH